jgi:alpha-tubulin suppressor-like RCC1 family protein
VAAGADYSTCALLTAGGASCWGLNTSGQLGNGTTTNSKTPVTVSQLFGSQSAIVVGNGFACALAAGGVGNCWGANASGQLGTGTTTNASTPVGLHLFDVLSVGLGTSSGCGVTMGGGVSCWGSGSKGELGDGATPASQPTPATTMIQSGATSVSVGGRAACVVTSLGGVQCWGDNSGGQLGNSNAGLSSTVPVDVIFP